MDTYCFLDKELKRLLYEVQEDRIQTHKEVKSGKY